MYLFSYWQVDKLKSVLRGSIVLFFLIWIVSKFWIEDFKSMDNFTSSLSSLLIASIALFTLVTILMETPVTPIYKLPKFWVSTAVLIYFAGNLFGFALSSIIIVWPIHNILLIVANLGYAGAFLCRRYN
ncbi:MAG: hypothetical protein V3U58_02490 [Thermodesulfobacteriota bacterium]